VDAGAVDIIYIMMRDPVCHGTLDVNMIIEVSGLSREDIEKLR
jgi:hypothetical protein